MRRELYIRRSVKLVIIAGVVLAAALFVAKVPVVRASPHALPANSSASGETLGEWMLAYTSWFLGGTSITPDANGNADVGHVVLLALPNPPADGGRGSIDITLAPGQAFTLPFFQWIGNVYLDGSVDAMADIADFKNMEISVNLDGVPIITGRNVMDYYTEQAFNPPLTTDLPQGIGATGWVFVQSVGMVHTPLPPGKHVLTLDETISLPDLGISTPLAYHNTWNIMVKRGE